MPVRADAHFWPLARFQHRRGPGEAVVLAADGALHRLELASVDNQLALQVLQIIERN